MSMSTVRSRIYGSPVLASDQINLTTLVVLMCCRSSYFCIMTRSRVLYHYFLLYNGSFPFSTTATLVFVLYIIIMNLRRPPSTKETSTGIQSVPSRAIYLYHIPLVHQTRLKLRASSSSSSSHHLLHLPQIDTQKDHYYRQ